MEKITQELALMVDQLKAGELNLGDRYKATHHQATFSEADKRLISLAFSSMAACKPGWRHAFKRQDEVDMYKKELGMALVQGGITTEYQIECGIAKLRLSDGDFMPSTGKFVAWCKSGVALSEHEVEQLFNQAAHRNFKDDLAYHAYVRMDAYEFRQLSASEARKLFDKALARALKEISEGHVITIPPPVAGHLEIKPSSHEKVNEVMNQLWEILR